MESITLPKNMDAPSTSEINNGAYNGVADDARDAPSTTEGGTCIAALAGDIENERLETTRKKPKKKKTPVAPKRLRLQINPDPPGAKTSGGVEASQMDQEDETKFPFLARLGIPLTQNVPQHAEYRGALLHDLLAFNEAHGLDQVCVKPSRRTLRQQRVIVLPALKPVSAEPAKFIANPKHHAFVEEILATLGPDVETSADMLCAYLAHKHNKSYQKASDLATSVRRRQELAVKNNHRSSAPLPRSVDVQSYDGTDLSVQGNSDWNVRYHELKEFRALRGHCKVPIHSSQLGRWVTHMRSLYSKKKAQLTAERIRLLDEIGFIWRFETSVNTYGTQGDPRMNRAMAARLKFPALKSREALLLGGYDELEAESKKNQDIMYQRMRTYASVKSPAKQNVMKLSDILEKGTVSPAQQSYEGDDVMVDGVRMDSLNQVFGDCAHLCANFIWEANKRKVKAAANKQSRDGPKRSNNDMHSSPIEGRKRARKKDISPDKLHNNNGYGQDSSGILFSAMYGGGGGGGGDVELTHTTQPNTTTYAHIQQHHQELQQQHQRQYPQPLAPPQIDYFPPTKDTAEVATAAGGAARPSSGNIFG
eukprot:scaffold29447_cov53-Attheya_sp.AAC.3